MTLTMKSGSISFTYCYSILWTCSADKGVFQRLASILPLWKAWPQEASSPCGWARKFLDGDITNKMAAHGVLDCALYCN